MKAKAQVKSRKAAVGLSKRACSIEESLTLALTEKVAQLKARGVDIISFGAGEPDFDTPAHIKRAAEEALAKGFTKYTSSSGILPLRKAVAKKLERENGLAYDAAQVLISCGAKQSIYNVIQAVLDEGDECVIAAPYWVSYPEMVKTAGARPVIVETREEDGFKLRPEALAAAIRPRTKLFIHCSPSNPTGIVYSEAEQRALAEVIVDTGILCLSDEVYEKLVFDGARHVSLAQCGPEAKERTVVVNSFSKTYAMTGWRIGYAAGPKDILDGCARIQSQSTSNPNSIAQYAAIAALEGPAATIEEMRAEYEKRRDVIVRRLRALPGVDCVVPEGAFYAFPKVSGFFGRRHNGAALKDSVSLAEALLDGARISVVPGAGFGGPEYVRLSYATSMRNITEGMDRFEAFVKGLE
jgi:aspartate aminotransferase